MKLAMIPVPLWTPPKIGPWTIRHTWPGGDTGLGGPLSIWEDRTEAEHWAELCNKHCRQGCTYVVVPVSP